MPAGDRVGPLPFSLAQYAGLERALARAEQASGLHFTAYIGELPEGRASAVALHRHVADPATCVLVAVDPDRRLLEIVTSAEIRERLSDRVCRLACLTMTSRFVIGDIAAGIRDGVIVLADHARQPVTLHTDEPG